ncbi:unnamed protein product [Mytilus coruscus]|uniref:Tyr recombinase domain-containing protein n=1 Tax=Mytilus coruscus TaxID=42192 RepID=A0A6J8ECJ9_MYTCO|nr:unnamed protein product [Mytilus coruscus]
MDDPDIADPFQYDDDDDEFLLIPLILPQFDLEVTYPDTASEEEENGTNPQTGTADISREQDEADDDRLDQVMLAEVEPNEDEDLLQALELVESQNETNQEPEFEDVNFMTNGRFPIINKEEKENIVDDANSKSTKKQTKYGSGYWKEKNVDFEDLDITSLDATLREFYAEVRSTDGNFYSKSTFVGIRASINRHLRAPPFNKTYALMDKSSFSKSNQMFANVKEASTPLLLIFLAHAGIADREIMKITGHKCETSLSSYHADSSDKQKRKYSALLQGLDETATASTDNVKISQSVAGSSNIGVQQT